MRYDSITRDDRLNGPGVRAVLWTAGCGHHCEGCHNPVTWDETGGLPFDEAARQELFEALDKPYISGITFSGGDPLHPANREEIAGLIRQIRSRFPDKTIWLYTGYTWEEIQDLPGVSQADVVVDGRFVQALKDPALHWRGSANQRLIDVRKSLEAGQPVLYPD